MVEKHEFEKRIDDTVTDEEYKVIESVYQWHPVISEVEGKEQIATLYKNFGMVIIKDMLPRAEKAREIEGRLRAARIEVERIQDELAELSY